MSPSPPQEDEAEVRALYFRLLECWNRRDAGAYATLFAEDGSAVGFDGSTHDGRAEIAETIGRIFTGHVTAAYVGKVREVRFLTPDVVLVRAVAGMIPPGGTDLKPEVNAVQSLVAVRRAGEWRIALFQNTPAQFHGRPEMSERLTEELRALVPGP